MMKSVFNGETAIHRPKPLIPATISRYSPLETEGIIFSMKQGSEIRENERINASKLIARRIYESTDPNFIERTAEYYFQDDDRLVFLAKHSKNCIGVNVTIYHANELTTEYLVGASDENYKGIGGIVVDLGRLNGGVEIGAKWNIARSYGYFGVKYLLGNGFKNPYFNNNLDASSARELITSLGYEADENLSFDRRKHRFYGIAPKPTRIAPIEDKISRILTKIEDWRTLFFIREMDNNAYQEISDRLSSSILKKERM